MRGGIAVRERAVAGLRDHFAVVHDHATDRDLAGGSAGAGFVQREIHEGGQGHRAPLRPGLSPVSPPYTRAPAKTWMIRASAPGDTSYGNQHPTHGAGISRRAH